MGVEQANLPESDVQLSRLIQGTMAIDRLGEKAAHALLDGVLELGCTTFDTAHVYGGGENERIFGRWLRSSGVRDDVVVVGKGCEPGPDGLRLTPKQLAADLSESLDRMALDHVDLYLVHVDDPSVPVELIVDALAEQAAAGRITAYGVSNWSRHRIDAAQAYARSAGLPPIAASSVHFSLAAWQEQPWPGNRSIAGPLSSWDSGSGSRRPKWRSPGSWPSRCRSARWWEAAAPRSSAAASRPWSFG